MKLFVGLGNPGDKHAGNRHNVGFMAVDRIADAYGFSAWRKKYQGLIAEGHIDGAKVLLLKPQTYMNESGHSVAAAANFHKIPEDDVVVFYDEIDLAPGKLKAKTGGGNAGHNGLKSITAQFGNDYQRVRIGVGHPGNKSQVANYVLRDFSKADKDWLESLLDVVTDSASLLAADDQAGFLTKVGQKLVGAGMEKEKPEKKKPAGKKSTGSDAPQKKKFASGHPAGARMAHRRNALVENLQKWLKKSKPDS